jgi:NAD(P)-dependent dehydrogenase (short-subunit alcohol dehydrogenase family)
VNRTYVVTGAASGIGAAVADLLTSQSDRVVRCDVHDADVLADLATPTGREALRAGWRARPAERSTVSSPWPASAVPTRRPSG